MQSTMPMSEQVTVILQRGHELRPLMSGSPEGMESWSAAFNAIPSCARCNWIAVTVAMQHPQLSAGTIPARV